MTAGLRARLKSCWSIVSNSQPSEATDEDEPLVPRDVPPPRGAGRVGGGPDSGIVVEVHRGRSPERADAGSDPRSDHARGRARNRRAASDARNSLAGAIEDR